MITASFEQFSNAVLFAFGQIGKGRQIVRFARVNGLWRVGVCV